MLRGDKLVHLESPKASRPICHASSFRAHQPAFGLMAATCSSAKATTSYFMPATPNGLMKPARDFARPRRSWSATSRPSPAPGARGPGHRAGPLRHRDPQRRGHEAVRDWETKLTPAMAESLRQRRRGKVGRSWYVDETYIKGFCRRSRHGLCSIAPRGKATTVPTHKDQWHINRETYKSPHSPWLWWADRVRSLAGLARASGN
jgi:hypothetical protein